MNKVLRYILIGGLFVIPVIPFIISPSLFFPFITGKNFTFRVIVEILFAVYLLLALRDPESRPKRTWLMYSASFVLLALSLSTIFSVNPYRSFWSNFERMEGLIGYLHLFAFFIIAATTLKTKELWHKYISTHMGAAFILTLYSLLQMGGSIVINQGGVRVDATLGNATYLAVYLLFNAFFAIYFLTRRVETGAVTSRWYLTFGSGILAALVLIFSGQFFFAMGFFGEHPIFSVLLGLIVATAFLFAGTGNFRDSLRVQSALLVTLLTLFLYTLYHTATRGAILGLVVGLIVTAVLFAFSRTRFFKRVGVGALVLVVLLGALFISVRNTEFVKTSPVLSRFANLSFSEQTTESRLIIWGMSLEGFKEKPIFGWGQENYNIVWNKEYDPRLYRQEHWFDRSHNTLIDWLVMTGIVGFVAQMGLFILAIVFLWKIRNEQLSFVNKSVFSGLLAAYFFSNIFVFDNLISAILYYSLVAFIYSLYVLGRETRVLVQGTAPRGVHYAFGVLLFAGLIFAQYQANVEPTAAGKDLIKAMQLRESISNVSPGEKDIQAEKIFDLLQSSINRKSFAATEVREQIAQTAYILRNHTSDTMDKKLYDFARREIDANIALHPRDARAYQLAGSFTREYKAYDEAIAYLEKARELSPKKQPILFELAFSYLDKGDIEKALATAKSAFDAEPKFTEARIFYGAMLIATNNLRAAEELLVPEFGTIQVFDDRIISAFARIGRYDQVIAIWQKKVTEQPNNVEYRIKLAVSYLQAKDPFRAIAVLEKAIKDFPEFKAQGEAYIAEIRSGQVK